MGDLRHRNGRCHPWTATPVGGKVEGNEKEAIGDPVKPNELARPGTQPGLALTLAASPAAREGYVALRKALAKGSLTGRLQEKIALLVADLNACAYCAAAHEELAVKMGIDDDEIAASRQARSGDAKEDAALKLAAVMVDRRGGVSDEELARARAAGLGDTEIVEVVANIALNVFRNYFALAAGQPTAQTDSADSSTAGHVDGDVPHWRTAA
jgi:AhpD family alkylhydroperoxidase